MVKKLVKIYNYWLKNKKLQHIFIIIFIQFLHGNKKWVVHFSFLNQIKSDEIKLTLKSKLITYKLFIEYIVI